MVGLGRGRGADAEGGERGRVVGRVGGPHDVHADRVGPHGLLDAPVERGSGQTLGGEAFAQLGALGVLGAADVVAVDAPLVVGAGEVVDRGPALVGVHVVVELALEVVALEAGLLQLAAALAEHLAARMVAVLGADVGLVVEPVGERGHGLVAFGGAHAPVDGGLERGAFEAAGLGLALEPVAHGLLGAGGLRVGRPVAVQDGVYGVAALVGLHGPVERLLESAALESAALELRAEPVADLVLGVGAAHVVLKVGHGLAAVVGRHPLVEGLREVVALEALVLELLAEPVAHGLLGLAVAQSVLEVGHGLEPLVGRHALVEGLLEPVALEALGLQFLAEPVAHRVLGAPAVAGGFEVLDGLAGLLGLHLFVEGLLEVLALVALGLELLAEPVAHRVLGVLGGLGRLDGLAALVGRHFLVERLLKLLALEALGLELAAEPVAHRVLGGHAVAAGGLLGLLGAFAVLVDGGPVGVGAGAVVLGAGA